MDAKLESLRRREVTLERKKIAEEKKRIEEDKAKVGFPAAYHMFCLLIVTIFLSDGRKKGGETTTQGRTYQKDQPLIAPFPIFSLSPIVGRLAFWISSHYLICTHMHSIIIHAPLLHQ